MSDTSQQRLPNKSNVEGPVAGERPVAKQCQQQWQEVATCEQTSLCHQGTEEMLCAMVPWHDEKA